MEIYVGNLSFETTDSSLRIAFERFGTVSRAQVITDRESNRSRGFGFVTMPEAEEARAAIADLNGRELDGREIKVNEARGKN
jgi:cold-inducible RNA-binding protein